MVIKYSSQECFISLMNSFSICGYKYALFEEQEKKSFGCFFFGVWNVWLSPASHHSCLIFFNNLNIKEIKTKQELILIIMQSLHSSHCVVKKAQMIMSVWSAIYLHWSQPPACWPGVCVCVWVWVSFDLLPELLHELSHAYIRL